MGQPILLQAPEETEAWLFLRRRQGQDKDIFLSPCSGRQAFISQDFVHPGRPWARRGFWLWQGISHLISGLNSGWYKQYYQSWQLELMSFQELIRPRRSLLKQHIISAL